MGHSHPNEWVPPPLNSTCELTSPDGKPKETLRHSSEEQEEAQNYLERLEARARDGKYITIGELRDSLRSAAALLCKSNKDEPLLLRRLIGIPFVVFTKQSIRLGVSLWLSIMNERPGLESRILALIAEGWEKSIYGGIGAFSPKLQ